MPLLEYDISIVGTAGINRAFQAIEARAAQHNTRMQQMFGGSARPRSAGQATATAAASRSAKERAEVTSAAKVARAREREELGAQRRITHERERAEKQMFSLRMRHLRQEDAERKRAEMATFRERKRLSGHLLGTGGRSLANTTRSVTGMVAGGLAIGGGIAAGSAIRSELDVGRRSRSLAVQARETGGDFVVTPEQIRAAVGTESIRTGESRSDVLAGLEEMVAKTGDIQAGLDQMQMMGDLALAFGASRSDLTAASAVLGKQFNIDDVKELADVMAVLGDQGRKASFELSDMASLVESLAASGSRFDLTGAEGAKTLGGLVQIVRTTSRSPEQAATGTSALIRQLIAKSGDLKKGKFGDKVDVFEGGDATGMARDIRDVIPDVISATGGDKVALQKIFGDEGMVGATAFIKAYSQANQAAGGGKEGDIAGREAIAKLFGDAIDSSATYADIQRDAQEMLRDDSIKLSQSMQELEQAAGRELLPVVQKFADTLKESMPEIRRFIEGLGEVAKFLIDNPLEGIGGIIAGKVALDIAAAGIGGAIKEQLVALIAGKTAAGAAGAAGGAAGTAATGLVAAAGWAALPLAADEGMQWLQDKASEMTGTDVTGPSMFDQMAFGGGFDNAMKSIDKAAGMEDAPQAIKDLAEAAQGLREFVRNPIDTLMGNSGKEIPVRIVNIDGLNRSDAPSPTNPRTK